MALGHAAETEFGDFYRRLLILRVGLFLVVALLGLRLWHLQIREGPYYRDLSENNRTRQVLLEPARGFGEQCAELQPLCHVGRCEGSRGIG